MRSVNIARLKNNLSRYLKEVRRGEEILIRDRKIPVAKIVPLTGVDGLDAETLALVAAGVLRLPEKRLTRNFWRKFWRMPGPRISAERAAAAVVADREED